MANLARQKRDLIEGNPVLIVIDIQASTFIDDSEVRSIDNMPGFKDRMIRARQAIDAARANDVPVIFLQEIHHPSGIDFGRELDGDESEHCYEDQPGTALARSEMGMLEWDYVVRKRRYSGFFGTDLDILLRGLKANTLILCGALTDVCVHYTFVDAHQHDYFCRVIEDCTAGSTQIAHDASLRAMEYLQTGAIQPLNRVVDAMAAYS